MVQANVIATVVSATTTSPELSGEFVTVQSEPTTASLFQRAVGTQDCVVPRWDWTCWDGTTAEEARTELARLIRKIDATINPVRFLSVAPTQKILDPRAAHIAELLLSPNTSYSKSDVTSAISRFDHFVDLSQLGVYAMESPCHTDDPSGYTCTWSNFPKSVDTEVWLDEGSTLHPKLAGSFFTKRAAAGLRTMLGHADSPQTQESIAQLVSDLDLFLNPYLTHPTVISDGSVRVAEIFLNRHPDRQPPPAVVQRFPIQGPLSDTTGTLTAATVAAAHRDLDQVKASPIAKFLSNTQLVCSSKPAPAGLAADTAMRIICGYQIYWHEVF